MFTFSFLNYRIPEGPIDQGPASGRIRALEEQLVKAKEQIENYKKQTKNGRCLYDTFSLQRIDISTNNWEFPFIRILEIHYSLFFVCRFREGS